MNKRLYAFNLIAVAGACVVAAYSGKAQAKLVAPGHVIYDSFVFNFEDAPQSCENGTCWFFSGTAGYDENNGVAHSGNDNLWANSTTGWNAVNYEFTVKSISKQEISCNVEAYIETSANFAGGIIDIWAINGGPGGSLGAHQGGSTFSETTAYHDWVFGSFLLSAQGGTFLVDLGFHGNNTVQWMRVDDVRIICSQAPDNDAGT